MVEQPNSRFPEMRAFTVVTFLQSSTVSETVNCLSIALLSTGNGLFVMSYHWLSLLWVIFQ
jgi:hypothetical protein